MTRVSGICTRRKVSDRRRRLPLHTMDCLWHCGNASCSTRTPRGSPGTCVAQKPTRVQLASSAHGIASEKTYLTNRVHSMHHGRFTPLFRRCLYQTRTMSSNLIDTTAVTLGLPTQSAQGTKLFGRRSLRVSGAQWLAQSETGHLTSFHVSWRRYLWSPYPNSIGVEPRPQSFKIYYKKPTKRDEMKAVYREAFVEEIRTITMTPASTATTALAPSPPFVIKSHGRKVHTVANRAVAAIQLIARPASTVRSLTPMTRRRVDCHLGVSLRFPPARSSPDENVHDIILLVIFHLQGWWSGPGQWEVGLLQSVGPTSNLALRSAFIRAVGSPGASVTFCNIERARSSRWLCMTDGCMDCVASHCVWVPPCAADMTRCTSRPQIRALKATFLHVTKENNSLHRWH